MTPHLFSSLRRETLRRKHNGCAESRTTTPVERLRRAIPPILMRQCNLSSLNYISCSIVVMQLTTGKRSFKKKHAGGLGYFTAEAFVSVSNLYIDLEGPCITAACVVSIPCIYILCKEYDDVLVDRKNCQRWRMLSNTQIIVVLLILIGVLLGVEIRIQRIVRTSKKKMWRTSEPLIRSITKNIALVLFRSTSARLACWTIQSVFCFATALTHDEQCRLPYQEISSAIEDNYLNASAKTKHLCRSRNNILNPVLFVNNRIF